MTVERVGMPKVVMVMGEVEQVDQWSWRAEAHARVRLSARPAERRCKRRDCGMRRGKAAGLIAKGDTILANGPL